MTGDTLTILMTTLNVGCTELGRVAGVSKQAIRFNQKSQRLQVATEERLVAALANIAAKRGVERTRKQTEHLLELAGAVGE